jgi:hypothetical protein
MPFGQDPTLLVNAQQAISNAMGVRGTRGIVSVALASNRRVYAHFAERSCINQQSQDLLYLRGELSRLTCTFPEAVICHGP